MFKPENDITVVISSSENKALFNCIESVGNDANVVVSMTPSPFIEAKLLQLNIPHVIVPRGNLGVTYNAGINLAETNKVIIANDDIEFAPKSIQYLSEGLNTYDACKAKINFQYSDQIPFSKIVANLRDFANSSPKRVFTPGLAFNKNIEDHMGGYFFNEQVRWAEDAEFSYRFHKSGLKFGYLPEATIKHPPVTLQHDLKGAFLIGLSKRRSVDLGLRQGDEDFLPTFKRLLSGITFLRKKALYEEKGFECLMYGLIWDTAYNFGYNIRKSGLSEGLEARIWDGFGRNK